MWVVFMLSTLNYLQRFYLLDLLMSEDYVNFEANWSSHFGTFRENWNDTLEWHLQDMFVELLIKFENSMSKFKNIFEHFKRSYIFLWKIVFFENYNIICVCVCVCVCIKGVRRYYRMFVNVDIISMRKSHHTGAICTVYWELKMFTRL